MRRLSVVAKLWLAFTGLILVVMVPLELALDRLLTDFYATQVTEPLLYHSAQLADMLAADPTALSLAPMMGRMVGGEVIVVDHSGKPLNFSGASQTAPPAPAVTTALTGDFYKGQVNGSIVTAVPIPHGGGAVLLLAPAEPVTRSLNEARLYLRFAALGTLLLGTLVALALSRSLLRPVLAIEQATRRLARGDFSTRVTVDTGDELGRLASAVNGMTAQLQAFENRRREFLANVAHELRTPLSYIQGYTQALAEGLVTAPEDRERYQRIVQEESVRVGRLVDDLMDLAQMEEGQMSLDLAPLDLHLPIEQALATIRPLAEEKGVAVHSELPADLPLVRADGGRMQQVVLNLVDNGLRYSPKGTAIRVSARTEPGWVTVQVTDAGPGIEAEVLPLIFERFQRRHSAGRGLGLAIVRSIVRAHGGDVGVQSPPGQGATFWFCLPVS